METIHESSKLKFVNAEAIRHEKEWWKLKNSEFLMYHPLAAKFFIHGMTWFGTINLLIISLFLYYKFNEIAGIILGIISVLYLINMFKFSRTVSKSKLTINDLSMGKRQ